MEFSKPSFKFFLLILVGAGTACLSHAANVSSCLQDGKVLFEAKQFEKAKQQFEQCVKTYPSMPETYLSLAGVLFQTNDLTGAETQFQNALKKMEKDSPYISYVYSMLGDIAVKQQKNAQALVWYDKSLSANPANVNSLIGKGIISEHNGHYKNAAEVYEKALSYEPSNLLARKRLINLEPFYFDDEQISRALAQRSVFSITDIPKITEKERDLFRHIHQAEQRRGTDYLKNKGQNMFPEYIVTIYKNTPLERDLLTNKGYQLLQKYLGQDAVTAFQKAGVPTKDVFSLRDLKGADIFDKKGFLTDEGYYAYVHTINGKKSFLLPHEDVPATERDLRRAERIATRLKERGYIEISRAEYNMLLDVTNCSEETLKEDLDVRPVAITKHCLRYFVQAKEAPTENSLKSVPYYYVMLERSKKNPSIKVPRNALVEYQKLFGHAEICLDDGKPLIQDD